MSSLLPNNATPQEVALDLATARIGNVDVPIRTLWDPENCPADILPWLAWAFSVDKWDATWTEAQKRAIVAAAIFVHQRKGTPAAVKEVVSAIFGGGDVIEAWQDVDLSAHEFKIVTTGTLQSEAQFLELIDLVDGAKPVRSHLVAVQIQSAPTCDLFFGTASRLGGKTTLRGRLAIDPDALDLFYGVATRYATRTTIDAQDPSFAVNGFEPEFVASFAKSSPDVKRWNYYRANGVEVDFSKAFDFARAGSATYVDATGTLQTAAANVPRVGHHVWDGSAWVNEGLLHESEARTNLVRNSTLAGAAVGSLSAGGSLPTNWTKNAALADADVEVVAVGTTSGFDYIDIRFNGTLASNNVQLGFESPTSTSVTNGVVTTGSVFAQRIAGTLTNITVTSLIHIYYVSGGTFHSAQAKTISISDSRLEQYHATDTASDADGSGTIATARHILQLAATSGNAIDITIRFAAPQFEVGPTPSSYIPTAGSTVTRAADVITIPAANLPWNPLAVSIAMEGRVTYADYNGFSNPRFVDWNVDTNNRLQIRLDTNDANVGRFAVNHQVGSSSFFLGETTNTYTPGVLVPFSVAGRFGSNFMNGAREGEALTARTDVTGLPDLSGSDLTFGTFGSFNGTIRTFRIWADDIGDTGIEEASA